MANSFVHVEILCKNLEKSKGFYESVFGWRFEPGPAGERFVVIDTGDSISGDLQEVSVGKPIGVTVFIGVDDIEATLKQVEARNGRTVMERQEIPGGYGSWALFADPEGNVLALSEGPK